LKTADVGYTVSDCFIFSHCKNGRLFGQAKAVLETELSAETGSDKQWKAHAAPRFASNDQGIEDNTLFSNELYT